MIKYFKIFILKYEEQIVPDGYSCKTLYHPILKGVSDYNLDQNFETLESAESAIEKYGDDWTDYIIQCIYRFEQ